MILPAVSYFTMFRCTVKRPPPGCSRDEAAKYREKCSPITDPNGVFKTCIDAVGTEVIYNSYLCETVSRWLFKLKQFIILISGNNLNFIIPAKSRTSLHVKERVNSIINPNSE